MSGTHTTVDEAGLRSWIADAVARTGVPGAACAVLVDDDLVHAEAGVVDVASTDPVTDESVFFIGSTGKVLTAGLLLQLADDGIIPLDDPIKEYVGPLVVGGLDVSAVTVRQLLDHTSGLPGHHFADFGRGRDGIQRYVASLATQPMIHPPGAMFSYCNGGYVVAGWVAEMMTGVPFSELIAERIVAPLRLRSTAATPDRVRREHITVGHEAVREGDHQRADLQVTCWSMAPTGSVMVSTASELAQLGLALSTAGDHRLMSTSSLASLVAPSVELPCPYWGRRAQCVGWGFDERAGVTVLSHGGGTTGHSAMLLAIPQRRVSVAVLVNSADGGALLAEAERWLLSNFGVPPARTAPTSTGAVADHEITELVGEYTDIWSVSSVERHGDGLVIRRTFHAGAVGPARRLPPARLRVIEPRLMSTGAGRPTMFIREDPADDSSPITYLHQLNASRRR